ncbi:MAG: class I SAM-dependent methyltransferase [Actinomycetia bacterium]|nr:class I SAM-dependent methyltransferase [Actinomycetes bacterium]
MGSPASASLDRVDREQRFHDERFADDTTRAATLKYYRAARAASSAYRRTVAGLGGGAEVLEYGCGPGSAAWDIAEAGGRVTGVDISPVAIDRAKREAGDRGVADCQFLLMNAEELEFDNNSFDLICGSGILHHLELEAAYGELARVMRPGGAAVFYEPLGHNPFINLYRRLTPAMRTEDEHPLTTSDLEGAKRRFRTVETEFHVLTALVASPVSHTRWGQVLASVLGRLDSLVFRLLPVSRRWAWIVVLTLGEPR